MQVCCYELIKTFNNYLTIRIKIFCIFVLNIKMNILYIYGYGGSANSATKNSLVEVFPEHNIRCVDYQQDNIEKAVDFLQNYIYNNKINIVVASSYGAFISLFLRNVIKFLINPCMNPSVELKKLNISDAIINDAKKNENKLSNISFDESLITFGLFSDHDELFGEKYKEMFKYYGEAVSITKCGHRANKEMLETEFKPMFNNLVAKAINNWKNN